jgi:sugar lactone lactonase YvrE
MLRSFAFATSLVTVLAASTTRSRAGTIFMYVTNNGNRTLSAVDPNGKVTVIAAKGPLMGPSGLAFNGNLFVANTLGNTIEEYSPAGMHLKTFATTGLSSPDGLTFGLDGNLYVTNTLSNTIESYSPAGKDLGAFADTGLQSPHGLTFNQKTGDLFVANTVSGTIEEFSDTGVDKGAFVSKLGAPVGLAFDQAGNLYVTLQNSGTVDEFNSKGTLVKVFAKGLDLPWGLTFDDDGNLYVANAGNNTIEKFNSAGKDLGAFVPNLLNAPHYLLIIPEPSTLTLLGIGMGVLVAHGLFRAIHPRHAEVAQLASPSEAERSHDGYVLY